MNSLLKAVPKGLAAAGTGAFAAIASASGALAQVTDYSDRERSDWGLGLPEPATEIAERLFWFHDVLLMPVITIITLFVLALLLWVMFRFRESANPEPAQFTHNATIEVLWTAIPAVILAVIAFPSFTLLYDMDKSADADMTLKVTGFQWAWKYEYIDQEGLEFEAFMTPEGEETEGRPRLLSTDNIVVVPSDTKVRLLITADDVIHAWAMQPFAVKLDAVPGRINETWFKVKAGKEGIYYGQCSEICGTGHAYMPIMVEVVDKDFYPLWVAAAKAAISEGDDIPTPAEVAAAQ